MLPYFAFWPTGNGPNLGGGVQLAYYNPKQTIQENFGTLRSDYIISDRDTLSVAYTIDDGNSIIPLADPLFASSVTLRAQVASLHETHIVSPNVLNSFTAGFSRAAFTYGSYPYTALPSSLDFVTGAGLGGIAISAGTITSTIGAITSAGSNAAAGVSERATCSRSPTACKS